MKLDLSIEIKANIEQVWNVVAVDFANSSKWMTGVFHSTAHENGYVKNVPCQGRICVLDNKSGGLKAEENILTFNNETYTLGFEVVPIKEKGLQLPIRKNTVTIKLIEVSDNCTLVSWQCNVELKIVGLLLAPLLNLGLRKAFSDLLNDLKHYCETGQISEKKRKFNAKAVKHLNKSQNSNEKKRTIIR